MAVLCQREEGELVHCSARVGTEGPSFTCHFLLSFLYFIPGHISDRVVLNHEPYSGFLIHEPEYK